MKCHRTVLYQTVEIIHPGNHYTREQNRFNFDNLRMFIELFQLPSGLILNAYCAINTIELSELKIESIPIILVHVFSSGPTKYKCY